jgi:uncharacterized protein YbbC (DUF1343 family)
LGSSTEPLPNRGEAGADVLREGRAGLLSGHSIGLITNPTGRTIDGFRRSGSCVEAGRFRQVLFAPEHGFRGDAAAGDEMEKTVKAESGIPIHSLYGETRAPTPSMLSGVDVLVFDIQDAGVRFFTYASTMKLAMESAAREESSSWFSIGQTPGRPPCRRTGPRAEARIVRRPGRDSAPPGMTVGGSPVSSVPRVPFSRR